MEPLSFPSLAAKVPTEADAYKFLELLRWHGQPVCPHCGSIGDHRFLEPSNGTSRKTNRGSESQRRVWKCRDCKQQFSVLTNTIMHGTHIPVRTWVLVFFELCSNKNGLAAREVVRKYQLSPKSAWFLLHRIREAMMREPAAGLLSARSCGRGLHWRQAKEPPPARQASPTSKKGIKITPKKSKKR
jgi:transposase-like protein